VSGDRSEQPTPRRLEEARRRGEVATSGELTAAAALAGGLAALALDGRRVAGDLAGALRGGLLTAVAADEAPERVLRAAAGDVLRLALPVSLAALAAAALAGMLQAGPGLRPGALAPRLERLDPVRGLRRLASPAQLLRAPLGLAKAVTLLALTLGWLRDVLGGLAQLPRAGGGAALTAAPALFGLALRLVGAVAVFGVLDLALARRRHRRALMMSRDEVRRELKEDEGDPERRAERRRLHRAVLEAGPVAHATVVVVNPSHVAVALRHERGADAAPRVLAKGIGRAAARIRSAARRAGVPIVRNVALARALHRLAEVGDEIPEELYEAAAAVLAHLYAGPERP
jgi:flagellar biosynthesis protein FlhB